MKVKFIRNIKIKTKLLLLGGISIAGLIFMGSDSIITARQINEASTEISQSCTGNYHCRGTEYQNIRLPH